MVGQSPAHQASWYQPVTVPIQHGTISSSHYCFLSHFSFLLLFPCNPSRPSFSRCPAATGPAVSRSAQRVGEKVKEIKKKLTISAPRLPPLALLSTIPGWLGNAKAVRGNDSRSGVTCRHKKAERRLGIARVSSDEDGITIPLPRSYMPVRTGGC